MRLQPCNDDGCGKEVSQTVDAAVPAIWLNLASAQDAEGQVKPRTFAASWDPVEGATSYILSWRRAGDDPPASAPPDGPARQTRSTPGEQNRLNLPGDRTSAEFNVPDDGEYRAKLEARNDEDEVIAQGDNKARQGSGQADTTPPRLVSGTVDSDTMTFYFSEPMDPNYVGVRFRVMLHSLHGHGHNSFTADPTRVEVSGNQVVLFDFGFYSPRWPEFERARVGQDAQVYYYKNDGVVPATERIRDLAGNEVWTPYSLGGHDETTRTIWLTNLTQPPQFQDAVAHPRWADADLR